VKLGEMVVKEPGNPRESESGNRERKKYIENYN
jgi:hypothetical protein